VRAAGKKKLLRGKGSLDTGKVEGIEPAYAGGDTVDRGGTDSLAGGGGPRFGKLEFPDEKTLSAKRRGSEYSYTKQLLG